MAGVAGLGRRGAGVTKKGGPLLATGSKWERKTKGVATGAIFLSGVLLLCPIGAKKPGLTFCGVNSPTLSTGSVPVRMAVIVSVSSFQVCWIFFIPFMHS